MFSSIVIVVVGFLFLVFFIFYKRDMLLKMFSIDVTSSANRFQEQLEQTADIVIKRLEEQITHLEYLLEEANEKIIILDNKIQTANIFLNKEDNNITEHLSKTQYDAVSPNEMNSIGMAADKTAALSIDNYKDIARNDKRSLIIAMADSGCDINEIAKTTGISKGEIMLLMQLNKK